MIAYDGREFSGSQRQPGKRTVQGDLETAIAALFGAETPVSLAGRTDSGVHALGQVASCLDRRPDLGEAQIALALRSHLRDDVSVASVVRVPLEFDPRRNARWRQYRYQIWAGVPNPLVRERAMLIERQLDLESMRSASQLLVGEQDFASFAGLGKGVPWSEREGRGTVRRVWAIELAERNELHGRMIVIDVTGDAFLAGQVRSMIGALVEVGRGRKGPEWMLEVIGSRDRRAGPKSAPAHGLVLWHVGYEPFAGARENTGPSRLESTGIDRDGP